MLYNIILFIHILSAMSYVAGLGIVYVCVLGLRQALIAHTLRLWAETATRVTRTVVPVSGAGVTLAGIYMYIAAWRADGSWAIVSLIAFMLVGMVTGALQGRWIAIVAARVQGQSEESPLPSAIATAARDTRLMLTANGTFFVVIGVLLLMITKPDLVMSLTILGCSLAVGLVVGAVLGRQHAAIRTSEKIETPA